MFHIFKKKKLTWQEKTVQVVKGFLTPAKLKPAELAILRQTNEDFKNALLLVSLLINAFFLTGWLVLKVAGSSTSTMLAYFAL